MMRNHGIGLLIFSVMILFCLLAAFAQEDTPAVEAPAEAISVAQDSTAAIPPELSDGIKVNKEKISLDLKGIDVIELFRVLSLKMGITIAPTKSVSGRINIFLNNLTFEDALDVILISQDLACDRTGTIVKIMTAGEYEKLYGQKYNEQRKFKSFKLSYAKPAAVFAALGQIKSDIGKVITDEATGTILLIDIPEKLDLMEATIKDLDQAPETEVFDLKYAKSADMKTHLSAAITTGPGEIFVDDRSSKVVVTDLPEKMKKIKRMLQAFDEETRQVFIEAEIVQITLKDEYQKGVNWERVMSDMSTDSLNLKGAFPVANSFTPSPLLTADYFKLAVGVLAKDKYNFNFSLLQTLGDTKILSRPRITVVNNQEAKIMVGSREAYVTQTQSQAESTTVTAENIQFIDVGVKLNVVPTINSDGFVTMKIKPEVSSVRETLTTSLKSVVPIVETAESETVVKVKDGTMIMIAGLMKDDNRRDLTGIPWLSRIPVLGALFGARGTQKKRTEIVVFITPHIIVGDVTASNKEIQVWFPPDAIPDEMGDSIISKRVDEIKVKTQPQENQGKVLLSEKQLNIKQRQAPAAEEADIQSKLKGLKEY